MMRRGVVISVAVIAAVVVAFVAIRIVDSTSDNRRRTESSAREEQFRGIKAEYLCDSICEVLVEFGDVPYSTTATKSIRLTNSTDTPLVLVDYTTQCRCMWLEFDRSPLASGASRDIDLYFDSRGEWGTVGNYMEITTSNADRPIVLWISADVE